RAATVPPAANLPRRRHSITMSQLLTPMALPPLPPKYKAVALCGVAALVAVFVAAIYGNRGWVHLRDLQGKQPSPEDIAFPLQRENEKLQQHLRGLANDDAYIEKLARERLGWIKPGETVYRVRGVTAAAALPPPITAPAAVGKAMPSHQTRPRAR